MSRSEICIKRTLRHEGGYVNHPDDPGGATNRGITLANFRRYVKPSGTIADLKALTEAQAVTVYKRQYWDAVNGDSLPHGIDFAVYDFGVNSGPSRAAKYLQGALGVPQDGVIGPKTIAAAMASDHAAVIIAICDARMAFLKGLKTWPTFGKGWSARVASVMKDALGDIRRPDYKSPAQTKTVQVSATQIAAGAGSAVTAVGALDGTAQIVALVFAGIIILGGLWLMRSRIRAFAEGDR